MANKNMFMQEYLFKGKQCDMVNALTNKIDLESDAKIFSSTIELFIFAALIGCYHNKRSKPIKDNKNVTKIFPGQFQSHSVELKRAFKIVTLTANSDAVDPIERLNNTFRYTDADDNFTIFEEYMLGGLEIIYDAIFSNGDTTYQDCLVSLNKLIDPFNEQKEDVVSPSNEDFLF